MAQGVTADAVVAPALAVVFARVPVLARLHAVAQALVVQHRQIEAAAIPAYPLRLVLLDRMENFLHHLAFVLAVAVHKGMEAKTVRIAQHTTDHQRAL